MRVFAYLYEHRRRLIVTEFMALLVFVAMHPDAAHAAQAAGNGLPWDAPFTTLKNDLTGPTAYIIALIAAAVALAGLLFAAQFHHAVEKLCLIVFIMACIYGLAAGGSSIFLVSGAVV